MAEPRTELSRDLSLFDVTMIGVGAMIGAGIFVLTGLAAGVAGPALVLAFALNGVITIFTAIVYAELGSAIPEAGGGYLWVKQGLPGPHSFLAGWMSWFAHSVAGSLYALGFASYVALVLSEFHVHLGWLNGAWLHKGLAVAIIGLFLFINFKGARETGTAGNIVTVLKVLILLLFIASGLVAIIRRPEAMNNFHNFMPRGFAGVLSAMGLTFVAFEGYEIIVQAGEETESPRRNIPKAVFLSLAIVVPIYMLVSFVAIGATRPDTNIPTYQWLGKHAELGLVEAARQFMPLGAILLLAGGILSTMSALNATTYSSTRVSFAMGRGKSLPGVFGKVHGKTRTPYMALLFSGALIIGMAVVIPIKDVASAADIMFLLLFLQVNVAVMSIRKKFGDRLRYGFLMPFFPVVPIIGIVTKLFLALFMFHYSPLAWYFALAWMGLGAALYYFYVRSQEQQEDEEQTPVVKEAKRASPEEETRYRVLVAIANLRTLPALLRPAAAAARRHDGSVILLHVVTVPDQLPISAGRAYIRDSQPVTRRAQELAEQLDVPVDILVRVSHRPRRAIAQTAREEHPNLLIMGTRGTSWFPRRLLGRNIDPLMEHVRCDILVLRGTDDHKPRRILIPIADSVQIQSVLEFAATFGGRELQRVELLKVFSPKTNGDDHEAFSTEAQEKIDKFIEKQSELSGKVRLQTETAPDPVPAILRAAAECDLMILRTAKRSWLLRRFFTDRLKRILASTDCPAVVLRPQSNIVSHGLHRLLNLLRGEVEEAEPEAKQELEEQGMLKTEKSSGADHIPHTAVNLPVLAILALLTILSTVVMFLGAGGFWTWVSAAGFILILWLFAVVCVRGVRETER